jgi:transposase
MAQRRRPPRITEELRAVLVEIVQANPTATLEEVQRALDGRTGIKAHAQTIQKRAGLGFLGRSISDGAGRYLWRSRAWRRP